VNVNHYDETKRINKMRPLGQMARKNLEKTRQMEMARYNIIEALAYIHGC
jgi:hypothetical protein